MKTFKKLPILFALLFTLFAASCSDIEFEPVGGDDEDDEPIIIGPGIKPSSTVPTDTVSFG